MPMFRVSSPSCRRVGAIGKPHPDSVIVVAQSHDAAILATYEQLDHISQPNVERVATNETESESE